MHAWIPILQTLIQVLVHLELCFRSVNCMSCCSLSVRHPSLAFHIFDIPSRTIDWIELKLSWMHCGNMEIQNRIAKIFPFRYPKWPLWWPSWNSSNDIFFHSDWAQIWGITVTKKFRIAIIVSFDTQDVRHIVHLENIQMTSPLKP